MSPVSRGWVRLVASLAGGLVLAIAAIAALTIALLANSHADTAAKEASGAVKCVNRILGERAQLTRQDAVAHIDFAKVLKNYNAAFATLILDVAKQKPQTQTKTDFDEVVRQAPMLAVATTKYDRILAADQAARDAHPFSKCS